MKYWIFQNNQVGGPFDPDALTQLPAFSPEALVCPEGRKGTSMGDWQRAGMLPELSVALLKASQLAHAGAGMGRESSAGGLAGLPPEPTLRDLAALGSLQEKIALLEGSLLELQDGLRRKDTELLNVHRELEEKKKSEAELASKLAGLEERLSVVSKIRSNLDEAIAAEKGVEGIVERQRQSMEELSRGLESIKEERAQLRRNLDEAVAAEKVMEGIVERQRQAIDELTRALETLKQERARDSEKLAEMEKARAAVKEQLPPLAVQTPPAPQQSAPPAPLAEPLSPSVVPPSSQLPKAATLDAHETAQVQPVQEEAGPQAPQAASAPSKLRKNQLIVLGAFVVIAAVFAALQSDMIGIGQKASPAAESEETAAPAAQLPPPEAAEIPSAEAQMEQMKQQAIELVRSWPSGDGMKTVGQRLEEEAHASGLSPWMAEKLAEGIFQVNFYAQSAGSTGGTIHEFQARLAEKQVGALNLAAKAILEKEPAPPAAAPKPRKVRVRPKPKPLEAEAQKAAPKPASDAELLDELLKP